VMVELTSRILMENNMKRFIVLLLLFSFSCKSFSPKKPVDFDAKDQCDQEKMYISDAIPDKSWVRAKVVREIQAAHTKCGNAIFIWADENYKVANYNYKVAEESAGSFKSTMTSGVIGAMVLAIVEILVYIGVAL
jgi:hypothetical protein